MCFLTVSEHQKVQLHFSCCRHAHIAQSRLSVVALPNTTYREHSRSTKYHLTPTATATFSLPPLSCKRWMQRLQKLRHSVICEHACSGGNTSNLHFRGSHFEFRPRHRLSWLFVIFLSSRKQIPGKYLSRAWPFPNPPQFITHQPPCCSTSYSLRQQQRLK